MRIISNKKWKEMDDLVVNLQLDYNDVKGQLELAEAQVKYLQKEIEKLKGEKKSGRKERKNVQKK